jgi:hypothetical protein
MTRTSGMFAVLTVLCVPALVNADPPPPPKAKPSAPANQAAASPRKAPAPQTPAKTRTGKGKPSVRILFTEPSYSEENYPTTRDPRRTRDLLLTPIDRQRFKTTYPLITPNTRSETKHLPAPPDSPSDPNKPSMPQKKN